MNVSPDALFVIIAILVVGILAIGAFTPIDPFDDENPTLT